MTQKWSWISRERLIGATLLSLLLISYTYTFPRWADWNQNSRMDQILAIVDRGVLHIDDYYQNTGDYAFYDGHYYSDKAPGSAFAGVPFYVMFKALVAPIVEEFRLQNNPALMDTLVNAGTDPAPEKVHFAAALHFVAFFTVSVPSALLGLLLYKYLGRLTADNQDRLVITLGYGMATIAFPYSGLLVGHQLASFLLFAAFFLAFGLRDHPGGKGRLMAIGLLLGYSVITDYLSAIVAIYLLFYSMILLHEKIRIIWVAIGASAPVILAMFYNYSIFRTPLPVAYRYSVLFPEHFQTGLMGFSYPKLEALWGISLSPFRGLFFLSPFLLLSIPAVVIWIRQGRYKIEAILVAACVITYFIAVSSMAGWSGGFAVGPRHLSAILPFIALPLAFLLEQCRSRRWLFVGFLGLVFASGGLVWLETLSGQQFPGYSSNPLIEYSLPKFLAGDIARNLGMVLGLSGNLSLLPLILFICFGGIILWVLSRGPKGQETFA